MPSRPSAVASRLAGIDGEHEHLAAEPARRAQRGGRRDRGLADAAGAAEHDDLLRREQLLVRAPASARSQPELLAERVGDHARDPQSVRRARTGTARRAAGGRRSRSSRRGAPHACAAATPRGARRRAPRRCPAPARAADGVDTSGSRSASNVASSAWVNSSGSTRFTMTVAERHVRLCARSWSTSSIVSVDRHLLGRGDDVDAR